MAAPPSTPSTPAVAPAKTPRPQVPPLENGDHLTRYEFERRYEAMPHVKKAELIEGVVYMPSPVSLEQHGEQHGDLIAWLGVYRAHTPGIRLGDNTTIRLDLDNEPQPDGLLLIEPARGGQAVIEEHGYIVGAPELAAEVSASTVSIDLHTKLRVYRRNEVREYLVWRVLDRAIDWFVLREGQYERLALTAEGLYQSVILPGLWLDPAALIGGNLLRVHEVLHQGLASPEHAAFVARLQQAASPQP
jgi:Uma2 family endonuclease